VAWRFVTGRQRRDVSYVPRKENEVVGGKEEPKFQRGLYQT